jgi:hypothetical protein
MNIEDIQTMWEQDSLIDDNHLGEASTETAKVHSKYIKLMVGVKLKLTKARADYNLLRKNKFRYYRGELSREELQQLGWEQYQLIKPLKNEMDEFLQGDQDLITLNTKIEYLETMGYLLEGILGQIKARDWQLKNGIEWKKFLAGM